MARGLCNCRARASEDRLSSCAQALLPCGIFRDQESNPYCPALADSFLSIVPAGEPLASSSVVIHTELFVDNLTVCFLGSSVGKQSLCSAGDPGSIPGLGISTGEGIGYPLQDSGLENSMDCICIVHGVTKSWTLIERLSLALLCLTAGLR